MVGYELSIFWCLHSMYESGCLGLVQDPGRQPLHFYIPGRLRAAFLSGKTLLSHLSTISYPRKPRRSNCIEDQFALFVTTKVIIG